MHFTSLRCARNNSRVAIEAVVRVGVYEVSPNCLCRGGGGGGSHCLKVPLEGGYKMGSVTF